MSKRLVGLLLVAPSLLLTLVSPGTASAWVKIHSIRFDPVGRDTKVRLNDEFIVIINTGDKRVSLSNWKIREVRHRNDFIFPPTFRLRPDRTVTIHSGSGANSTTDLYWHSDRFIWSNHGDTAILHRRTGTISDTCHYSGIGHEKRC